MNKVVLAMPVFNESSIIKLVIEEYLTISGDFRLEILVVDDHSTDETLEVLQTLAMKNPNRLHVFQNNQNHGHGPTFCRALQLSLLKKPDLVVSCDGDGPISGHDLKRLLENRLSFDMVEIARKNRVEPFFRFMTSFATRILVFFKSGKFPEDANTPLRLFNIRFLEEYLPLVNTSKVPNLLFSILARRDNRRIVSSSVVVQERKPNQLGTMWGKRFVPNFLPNMKFLKFCMKSFFEVVKFKPPHLN